MHDHNCQYNNTGEQRIRTVAASIKSLPNMSFMDHHRSYIIGKSREAMGDVYKADGQNMTTIELQKPLAPIHLFSTLEAELNSINSIQTSYKSLILAATHLLKKEPSSDGVLVSNKHMRRSLLPFFGDALSWLTGTATTKDV